MYVIFLILQLTIMDDDRKVYIKDLTVKTRKGYLCVRVLRKWIYDGNKPGGPILYIGLVLADEEVCNSILIKPNS
jgi:hypothetical protein